MNRRISFLVTNIDPNVGGTERVTYTLYENFKTIGYTPFLIYCGKDNEQIPTSKKLKISLNSSADTISTSISDYVKKNRHKVLFDHRARKKARVAALLSYFGTETLRMVLQKTNKRKKD